MDVGEEGKDCVITDTTHTFVHVHAVIVRMYIRRTLPNLTLSSPLTSMGSVLKRQMDHSIPDV